jgi:hypothetical protein
MIEVQDMERREHEWFLLADRQELEQEFAVISVRQCVIGVNCNETNGTAHMNLPAIGWVLSCTSGRLTPLG